MRFEILNASVEDNGVFPRKVIFRPAYSGGIMYADGISIPEPTTVNGEEYPAGTKLPVVVDLSNVVLEDNIPILYNHDSMLRIGHTESVTTDGQTLQADGVLESPSQWTKEVIESFNQGAKWQCSIGSGIIDVNNKQLVPQNESITVNGQTLSGPFTLLTNLRVREISIVPAGADPNTETLLATLFKEDNAMDFETFLVSKGFNPETLTEENRAALEALWKESNAANEELTAEAESEEKEEEKEETSSESDSTDEDKKEETVKATCEEDDKKETVQASIKTSGRILNTPASSAAYVSRSAETAPTKKDILQASCLLNLKVPAEWLSDPDGGGFSKRTVDMAIAKRRDVSLLSLMGEQLQASGVSVDYRNPRAIVENYKETLQASGVSTKNFGNINIFSPIIDKQMRYKYEQIESIWKLLLKKRTVRDFKNVATVDFDVIGKAKDILENEDYPTVELKSSGNEFKAGKQGLTAAISFESQVNDDMDALDGLSEYLLQMVYDAQVDKFWTLFWSKNSTVFTTGKGNKITKALGVDGLSLARKTFGSLKNANGRFINIPPKAILVPQALEAKADDLFNWQWAGENNTRANTHVGRYQVITDPYLGAEGGYSGASDTGWFMIGDTQRYPIGEYAVWSGFEAPGIKETWYDHKDALCMRAMGTIGFHLYEDKIPMVYSTGTVS